jgi:hypothetical protein
MRYKKQAAVFRRFFVVENSSDKMTNSYFLFCKKVV